MLQGKVSHAHEAEIDRERDYREANLNLIVLLWIQNQEEQNYRKDVFEVETGVNYEVVKAKAALISICIDLVRILDLVRDYLM